MGATVLIDEDTTWFVQAWVFDCIVRRLATSEIARLPEIFQEASDSYIFRCDIRKEDDSLKLLLADLVAKMAEEYSSGQEGAHMPSDVREGLIEALNHFSQMLLVSGRAKAQET